MGPSELDELQERLNAVKAAIREIAHDISGPLGVLRMAAYFLQTAKPDEEKREHYYKLIVDTVEKVEGGLKRLRALNDDPSLALKPSDPQENQT
jgi:nitrogen-specific signal transduction histidine kinase